MLVALICNSSTPTARWEEGEGGEWARNSTGSTVAEAVRETASKQCEEKTNPQKISLTYICVVCHMYTCEYTFPHAYTTLNKS